MNEQYIERYWRDATPEDAIKEPPMVARFRDEDDKEWIIGKLLGFDRSQTFKWCGETRDTINCQVYDAPDPGEGWRLIDPEKDDHNQNGIEYWSISQKRWLPRYLHNDKTLFLQNCYRIRIEPLKPKYVPFTWEDREQLRGRWLQRKTDSIPIEQIATKFETGRRGLIVNGIYGADLLLKQWTFLDTGEPVGKRVVQ